MQQFAYIFIKGLYYGWANGGDLILREIEYEYQYVSICYRKPTNSQISPSISSNSSIPSNNSLIPYRPTSIRYITLPSSSPLYFS